ncbi:hypothetical protein [Plebeiibacterium marinum]|uniref:Outer membrane protein beta-barrel domain-containing protein n=1 Tax=Plebeiibacterium marinum TaxID=2992111 RepID=A0AAE3SJ25_9BACT|nr:hypothetical protein [Plebeiobacterium marinum]MCW3804968.1 hypothetical protein [Plebeiobacterium marinum]
MKKLIFTLTMVLLSTSVWSQESEPNNEIKTIFKSKGTQSNGGYGGIMINYSQIDNRDAILLGAKGGWLINHSFTIGLGGYGFITEPESDLVLEEKYEYAGGYGGLLIEPIIAGIQPIHVSFPILIGAGGIAYNNHYGYEDDNDEWDDEYYEDSDAFFVIEPGIEIEFNVIKFMRLAILGSYRYTSNINLEYRSTGNQIGTNSMLRGWNVGLCMKFGKF